MITCCSWCRVRLLAEEIIGCASSPQSSSSTIVGSVDPRLFLVRRRRRLRPFKDPLESLLGPEGLPNRFPDRWVGCLWTHLANTELMTPFHQSLLRLRKWSQVQSQGPHCPCARDYYFLLGWRLPQLQLVLLAATPVVVLEAA